MQFYYFCFSCFSFALVQPKILNILFLNILYICISVFCFFFCIIQKNISTEFTESFPLNPLEINIKSSIVFSQYLLQGSYHLDFHTDQFLKAKFSKSSEFYGEGNSTSPQYSYLENPVDERAEQAAIHGVTKSQTGLSNFTFTHWRRKWQPTPVFLPGESQGWGSLVGFRLWGHTESDTTEATQQQQQQQ